MSTKATAPPDKRPLKIIRKPELRALLGGCSDHHVDDLEAREGFPRHIRIAGRSVGWLEHEVEAWIEARMRERDQTPCLRPKLRPPLDEKLREQFREEENELRAELQHTDLSERERAGDVWADVPA